MPQLLTLACRDLGFEDCAYVAQSEREDDILTAITTHYKDTHRFNDRLLFDTELVNAFKACIEIQLLH
jgi:predicted small metal-binding protein